MVDPREDILGTDPEPLVPRPVDQEPVRRSSLLQPEPPPQRRADQRAAMIDQHLHVGRELGMTPEREAKLEAASRRTGLPIDALRELPESALSLGTRRTLADLDPVTREWMASDAHRAVLSHDDIDGLSTVARSLITGLPTDPAAIRQMQAGVTRPPPPSLRERWAWGRDVTVDASRAWFAYGFMGDEAAGEWARVQADRFPDYHERVRASSVFQRMVGSAAESIPLMLSSLYRGLQRGTQAAAAAMPIGAAYGAAAGAPFGGVGAKPGAIAGAASFGTRALFTGGKLGAAEMVFEIYAGSTFAELDDLRDINGQPIDINIKRAVAASVGVTNASMQLVGWTSLGRTVIPKGFKDRLRQVLADKNVSRELMEVSKRYGTAIGVSAMMEMGQETAQILGSRAGIGLSEMFEGTYFQAPDKQVLTAENIDRVLFAGQEALGATIVMGAPGTAVHGTRAVQMGRRANAHAEIQGELNEKIQAAKTQQRSPEAMAEFLQLGGMTQRAHLQADLLADAPPAVLEKLGITAETVERAESQGSDVTVPLSTLHTALTADEFKAVLPALRESETTWTKADVDRIGTADEIARAAEVYAEASKNEATFKTELKRLRGAIAKAVETSPRLREQARAQGQTSQQFAAGHVALLEAFSRRMALEGRELTATLEKITARAVRAPARDVPASLRSPEAATGIPQQLEALRDLDAATRLPEALAVTLPDLRAYLEAQGFDLATADPADVLASVAELARERTAAARTDGLTLRQSTADRMAEGGFLTPEQAAQRRQAEQADPQAETRRIARPQREKGKPLPREVVFQAAFHGGTIEAGDTAFADTYVTTDRDAAQAYAEQVGGRVVVFELSDNARTLTVETVADIRDAIGGDQGVDFSGRPFEVLDRDEARGALRDVGYDAVVFEDVLPDSDGSQTHSAILVLNEEMLSEASDAGVGATALYQVTPEGAQGSLSIGDNGYIISLFDGANLSTLVHETSHIFLEEMRSLVRSGEASQSLQRDWQRLSSWLESDLADPTLTPDAYRQAHERFARGFEEYLREGKAPTPELRTLFERFRHWMLAIYKDVAALGPDRIPLTDEVRGVFDRMLATQQEVAQTVAEHEMAVRPDSDLTKLGLSDEDKVRVNGMLETARQKAEEILQRRRDRSRRRLLKEWRKEARAEVEAQPVYQAMAGIKQLGGLRWARVQFDYGADTVQELRKRGLVATRDADGVQPETMAEQFGFDDAESMVIAMLDAETSPGAAIETLVSERSVRHDAEFNASDAMIDATEYGDYLEAMNRYIVAALKGRQNPINREAFQRLAEAEMERIPVEEATRTDRHLGEMQRALANERRAVVRGDFAEALRFNEHARLAYEKARVSKGVRDQVRQTIRKGNAAARTKPGTINEQHHLTIVHVMQRFGMLSGRKQYDLSRREPIAKLLANPDDLVADASGMFDDWLIGDNQEARPYKDLTVSEFHEVRNLVNHLDGQGRALIKDEVAHAGMERAAMVEQMLVPAEKLKDKKVWPENSVIGRFVSATRAGIAELDNLLSMARFLDFGINWGKKRIGKAGPNERFMYQPLARAWSEKRRLLSETWDQIKPHHAHLLRTMVRLGRDIPDIGVPVPENLAQLGKVTAWTSDRVIAVALNMGTESNRQAIMDGYNLNEGALTQLVSVLNDADWTAIQGVWDAVNSLWPKLNAVHFRLNHFHQKKVDSTPFVTPTDKRLSGGYYPLVFDKNLMFDDKSEMAAAWGEREDLLNSQHAMFPTPSVKKGFMQKRKGTGGLPVKLSLGVLAEHLDATTQYITHAEVIRDLDKSLSHGPWKQMVERKLGTDAAKQIRPTLARIARKQSGRDLGFWSKALERNRGLATAYILGMNIKSALNNSMGFLHMYNELGGAWYARGAIELIRDPLESYAMIKRLSPYMAERMRFMERDIDDAMTAFDAFRTDREAIIRVPGQQMTMKASFMFIWAQDMATVWTGWLGAYTQAMKDTGGDTQAAVQFADDKVASSQNTARPMDLSSLQANKNGVIRVFTMFSSYAVRFGHFQRAGYRLWREGGITTGAFVRQVILTQILPPFIMRVVYSMLRGDELDEEMLKDATIDILLYQFMGLPFLRDLVAFPVRKAQGEFAPSPGDSPLFVGYQNTARAASTLLHFAEDMDDDERMETAIWAFSDAVAYLYGLPLPRFVRTLKEGMRQFEDEDGTPFNILVPDPAKRQRR